jgi:hypothetical protein
MSQATNYRAEAEKREQESRDKFTARAKQAFIDLEAELKSRGHAVTGFEKSKSRGGQNNFTYDVVLNKGHSVRVSLSIKRDRYRYRTSERDPVRIAVAQAYGNRREKLFSETKANKGKINLKATADFIEEQQKDYAKQVEEAKARAEYRKESRKREDIIEKTVSKLEKKHGLEDHNQIKLKGRDQNGYRDDYTVEITVSAERADELLAALVAPAEEQKPLPKIKSVEELMDPGFAVFNQHVNDAGKRALKILESQFPSFVEEVKKAEEEGIMVIFNEKPTPATAAYVALVTAFVNENRGE